MRVLLGRDTELSELRALITAPLCTVVLHGEAGVGKTALATAALADVDHRIGGGLATLSWMPYLPLRRAFADLPEEAWTGDAVWAANQVEVALGPRILVIEDAHWADDATLSVLEQLAGRVNLVVTIRRGDPAAADVLAGLEKAGADRLDLEPLGREAAAELAASVRPELTPQALSVLLERSGGNPLLIEELAAGEGESASLRMAVLARCRLLPETQLEGLALLALAGHSLAATHLPDPGGLVDSGLVLVDGDGQTRIRHALIGEVVGDLLSPERTQRCHRVLAALGSHPGDVARHLLAAGDREAAHVAALRAVEQSATPGERWRHLVTAAESADGDDRVELRLEAASLAIFDAPEAADRLLKGLPVSEETALAAAHTRVRVAAALDDVVAIRAEIAAGVDLAEPGSFLAHQLACERSTLALRHDGDTEAAYAIALDARAEALSRGWPMASVDYAVGSLAFLTGRPGWDEMLRSSMLQARVSSDFLVEVEAADCLAAALETVGQVDEALSLADFMAERAVQLRQGAAREAFRAFRVRVLVHAGRNVSAISAADAVLAEHVTSDVRAELEWFSAIANLDLGRVKEAEASIQRIVGAQEMGWALLARASMLLDTGRPAEALALGEAFKEKVSYPPMLAFAAPTFAWAAWLTGQPQPAVADFAPVGSLTGIPAELAGVRALLDEDWTAAVTHFEQAARDHRAGWQRQVMQCRWAVGEALRLGRDPAAATVLTQVAEDAKQFAMVPIVTRCERSLRALGVRTFTATRDADDPLSPRERQVVELVVEGLTDSEIGARLGLAHRTVQTQLASARRKLGAENRTHLVALLTDQP